MRNIPAITMALLLGASVLTTGVQAQTAEVAKPAKTPGKPIFLTDHVLDPALMLPKPVSADSAEGKAELDLVRKTVAASSPERIKQAAWDDAHEDTAIYSSVVPGFDLAKLPATALLFKHVENDQNYVTRIAKTYFARTRPFDLDHSIPTCVPSAFGKAPTSYPSGHTTMAYATGTMLAHLIPEKAADIYAKAKDYGDSRVICGVHYPSDLVASQTLGTSVAVALLENADFQKEFSAAKAELVAAGLTH